MSISLSLRTKILLGFLAAAALGLCGRHVVPARERISHWIFAILALAPAAGLARLLARRFSGPSST